MEELRLWAPVFISIATFAFVLIDRRRTAWRAELAPIEKRMTVLEEATISAGRAASAASAKVDQLERELQHMPTKEQVHRLELNVTEMKGDLRVTSEGMQTVKATTSRMEAWLLESSKAA